MTLGQWWKSDAGAELVKLGRGKYIRLVGTQDDLKTYDPLYPPVNKALKSDDVFVLSPVDALIRVETDEDAVRFASQWGLLGLRKVKEWKHAEKLVERHLTDVDRWLFNRAEAVTAYQATAEELRRLLKGGREELVEKINLVLAACPPPHVDVHGNIAWQFPSLYYAIYLSLLGGLRDGITIRNCEHPPCGKYFRPHRDDQKYCSMSCQVNAKRLRKYERDKDR